MQATDPTGLQALDLQALSSNTFTKQNMPLKPKSMKRVHLKKLKINDQGRKTVNFGGQFTTQMVCDSLSEL